MKTQFLFRYLVITLIFLSGCGTTITTEQITTPAYFWGQGNGLCSFSRAVDAQGNLWSDSGCESPIAYSKIGQLSSENLKKLEAEFNKLAAPTKAACGENNLPHAFTKKTSTNSSAVWEACATNKAYFDTTGLTDPYLSISTFFKP